MFYRIVLLDSLHFPLKTYCESVYVSKSACIIYVCWFQKWHTALPIHSDLVSLHPQDYLLLLEIYQCSGIDVADMCFYYWDKNLKNGLKYNNSSYVVISNCLNCYKWSRKHPLFPISLSNVPMLIFIHCKELLWKLLFSVKQEKSHLPKIWSLVFDLNIFYYSKTKGLGKSSWKFRKPSCHIHVAHDSKYWHTNTKKNYDSCLDTFQRFFLHFVLKR